MSQEVSDGKRATVAAGICAVALMLSVAGFWSVKSGQDEVVRLLTAAHDVGVVRTIGYDYTDSNGAIHHISITSESPAETAAMLVARLKAEVIASEKEFPRR